VFSEAQLNHEKGKFSMLEFPQLVASYSLLLAASHSSETEDKNVLL